MFSSLLNILHHGPTEQSSIKNQAAMETDGVRRSTRVRKPVKTYAVEQAEENDLIFANAPLEPKRKRKAPLDDEHSDSETSKPTKKAAKNMKSKTTQIDDDDAADGATTSSKPTRAASLSKPKRASTNSSWHASAAERRIAVSKRNVRQLSPGEEETRLRG